MRRRLRKVTHWHQHLSAPKKVPGKKRKLGEFLVYTTLTMRRKVPDKGACRSRMLLHLLACVSAAILFAFADAVSAYEGYSDSGVVHVT